MAVARAAVAIEAILLAPMLRPLAVGAGLAGDYEMTLLAQNLAEHDRNGFTAVLTRQLLIAP